jgi:hypothetical protein
MSEPKPLAIRFQVREELRTGLKDFDILRRSGTMKAAFTVAALKDGSYHFTAAGMGVDDLPPLMYLVVETLANITKRNETFKLDLPSLLPESPGTPTGRKRDREVVHLPDGGLQAPEGETFASCAECGSSRWLSTVLQSDTHPARLVCARCGNEVKFIRVEHDVGHA